MAYGFHDKTPKYGAELGFNLNRKQDLIWKTSYCNDVIEAAGTTFSEESRFITNSETYRRLFVLRMDRLIKLQSEIAFRMLKYIKVNCFLNNQRRWGKTGFLESSSLNTDPDYTFHFNEAGVQLRWLHREKFIQTLNNKLSAGSTFPALYLNLMKGFKTPVGIFNSELDYERIDLKVDYRHICRTRGAFSIQLQTGYINGRLPYTLLYNNKGSYGGSFVLSSANTFETMRLNEFVSNKYAALFLCWNTGKLFPKNPIVNPQLELAHHTGIGSYRHTGDNYSLAIKTMDKVYLESGLRLQNLLGSGLGGFGIGAFYRYGFYEFSRFRDNLALKLCISFNL